MIRFTKAKALQKARPRTSVGKKTSLDNLYSFLNHAEPEAIEFLVSFWNTQAQGVTYAELREAFLAGEITPQLYQRWTEDYSQFIQDGLTPLWAQASAAGAAEVSMNYPLFVYEPSVSAAMGFIRDHGAELVTNITEEQRKALNAVISHISGYTAITPDEAARMIRPTVGLTVGQTLANVRHRQAVEAAYLKAHPKCNPKTARRKAAESAARYAGRQHRYRAQNIARTELAFAYNAGAYGATKDAQARGYIGNCVKVWLTAYDERVCPICSAMDDEKRSMDEPFSNGKLFPPAHPSCRCAVAYEEIPGTNLSPALTESSGEDIMSTGAGPGQTQPLTIEQAMAAQVEALPKEQKQALQRYTGFSATRINYAIRHGKITPEIQKEIDLLDAALKNGVMPGTAVLHRDTSFAFLALGLGLSEKPTAEELSRAIGRNVTNDIFTSTSFDNLGLLGRDTEIWLTVPAGYKGCQYIKPVALPKYQHQEEILFARGLRYRITDIRIENGKYVLFAEVLQ